MTTRLLSAALLKAAFETSPYRPGEMALAGGVGGGLLGAGAGALTGLIGTEKNSPERRKAVVRRALIGLVAGGGAGAVGLGLKSRAQADYLEGLISPAITQQLKKEMEGQLSRAGDQVGSNTYERLMEGKRAPSVVESSGRDIAERIVRGPSASLLTSLGVLTTPTERGWDSQAAPADVELHGNILSNASQYGQGRLPVSGDDASDILKTLEVTR